MHSNGTSRALFVMIVTGDPIPVNVSASRADRTSKKYLFVSETIVSQKIAFTFYRNIYVSVCWCDVTLKRHERTIASRN